jgi:adenosine deaminase
MNKTVAWRPLGAAAVVFLLAGALAHLSCAQGGVEKKPANRRETKEAIAGKNLAAARQNPLQLRHFLVGFPKGADLHYHLSGGIYAETFIKDAAQDGLCVNVKEGAFTPCPADLTNGEDCPAKWKKAEIVPAKVALCRQGLYDALVNSFSMRGFVPYGSLTPHDHFFDSFGKFSGIDPKHHAEWVDEVARRAAAQNEQYMELMQTPDYQLAAEIAKAVPWNDDFAKMREDYLARGLTKNVAAVVEGFREMEKKRLEMERCEQPEARAEACNVDVRFIWQVLRGKTNEIVFAQALLAFESAQADPERIVGINFVMPEDGYISRRDYVLHMKTVKYLHEAYPQVHIALHAGEMTYGQVPPGDLCCHIRLAVEAGAERIGHGVDIMYEDHPHELLREMAAKHVMVEINLSSNDLILGVSGKNHPLPVYREFAVPVALSTDDEGVSRIDLTNEYVRAVETYGLSYSDLKKIARTGMEHAFLPGSSLWAGRDSFAKTVNACAQDALGAEKVSKNCEDFLRANEKAGAQWKLEQRFVKFEAGL